MAQAIINPDEVRRFANNLKRLNNDLQNQLSLLHAQLNSLGSTWRDQEHGKFVEEFEQTMKSFNRFIEASNQHIPFLMRKAQRAEEYLQQH